jgi:hypothetical protein
MFTAFAGVSFKEIVEGKNTPPKTEPVEVKLSTATPTTSPVELKEIFRPSSAFAGVFFKEVVEGG